MNGDWRDNVLSMEGRSAVGVRHKEQHPELASGTLASEGDFLDRQKIRHDIHHELATIMLLASVLRSADDVGQASRSRADHLLGEARWLELLLTAYEDRTAGGASR